MVATMATANPEPRARRESPSRLQRRRTSATPRAATAPNSGPRTIAPMVSIWESSTIAIEASVVASTMNV